MKDVTQMSNADMVHEYNERTGKNIKKFSSRAAGEKQLTAARNGGKPVTIKEPQAKPVTIKEPQAKPVTIKEPQANSATRSDAIAGSWLDQKTASARAQRHNVSVDGHGEFRSVKQAFDGIGLPLNQHIKFRMLLKAEGKATFVSDKGSYKFKIL